MNLNANVGGRLLLEEEEYKEGKAKLDLTFLYNKVTA